MGQKNPSLEQRRRIALATLPLSAIERFVTPDEFKSYETIAYTKGFLMVSSSPLTRSSHHAGDDFARLRAARAAKLKPARS